MSGRSESSRTTVRALLARAMLLLATASVLCCAQLAESVSALLTVAGSVPVTGGAILSDLSSVPVERSERRS